MLCRSIAVGGAIFGRFAVLNELWRKRMIDERQSSMFFQETNSNKIGYLWLKWCLVEDDPRNASWDAGQF